jgi:hypothetical protein
MTQKETPTLTERFNEVTVKKGDIFQVDLVEGGIAGVMWNSQVVSGKATLLSATSKEHLPGACDGQSTQRRVYRAEEAGEINIVAKSKFKDIAFKVHVN